MDKFYRAHEFAKLAGVTVRALHHYDRIGVLKPRRSSSGHRLYGVGDLERLEQIAALKFLGIPLKEIKLLLGCNRLTLLESLRLQLRSTYRKTRVNRPRHPRDQRSGETPWFEPAGRRLRFEENHRGYRYAAATSGFHAAVLHRGGLGEENSAARANPSSNPRRIITRPGNSFSWRWRPRSTWTRRVRQLNFSPGGGFCWQRPSLGAIPRSRRAPSLPGKIIGIGRWLNKMHFSRVSASTRPAPETCR